MNSWVKLAKEKQKKKTENKQKLRNSSVLFRHWPSRTMLLHQSSKIILELQYICIDVAIFLSERFEVSMRSSSHIVTWCPSLTESWLKWSQILNLKYCVSSALRVGYDYASLHSLFPQPANRARIFFFFKKNIVKTNMYIHGTSSAFTNNRCSTILTTLQARNALQCPEYGEQLLQRW